MNAARWVMAGFGVMAFVMFALPAGMLLRAATQVPPTGPGLGGEISRAFLSAKASALSPTQVPEVARVLPIGMSMAKAVAKFAESNFVCTRKAMPLSCVRSHDTMSCNENWCVEAYFAANHTIQSITARRMATCL